MLPGEEDMKNRRVCALYTVICCYLIYIYIYIYLYILFAIVVCDIYPLSIINALKLCVILYIETGGEMRYIAKSQVQY